MYRATDTTLGRQVAIKVLPEAFAQDAERLARFEREAKTLASLNHPNIAAIYAVEKSGGITALVMELVEGDDLSQRIAKGAIPIDEALPIAKQIAEALEAAHEQGIIHRDLKPANIKVRAEGTVKVLDFGLAKAMDPTGAMSPLNSMSPTITTPAMTQAGMILGTAAYMSPEQTRGKPVDKRADIWAFGAVLYEMLTGTRAFPGEDLTDTLAAVVRAEPNWTLLPAGLPSALGVYLKRCLQKDPKQRIPDIAAMRLALEGAFETAAPQATAASLSAAPRGRLVWMAAFGVAAALAAALTMPALRHLRETLPPPPETRLGITTPATAEPDSFALSPDGRQIVFVASGDGESRLWLRPLGVTTAQPLVGTDGATYPFWSPDSRSIGLLRVAATGGPVTAVTTLGPQQSTHESPLFLPDGRRVLFTVSGVPDVQGVYLGALDGSAPTRLTPDLSSASFLPAWPGDASAGDGWLLWGRAGTLVAQRLDLDQQTLVGDPVTVADGAARTSGFRRWSVSAPGLVAYRTVTSNQRQLIWVDTSGAARGTVGDPDGSLEHPKVSPDGRRVVVARTVLGNTDLWLLDGARTSRMTFDPARDVQPVWSPDGTRVVFTSFRTGTGQLYQMRTNGVGGEERLVASDRNMPPTSWSRDGRFLLSFSTDPQTNGDVWVVPMVGDHTPSLFLQTPFREAYGAFSPDGRWVAYHSNASGRYEIYVRPFVPPVGPNSATGTPAAAASGQWQVSTDGGIMPVWRPDGGALYYLNPAGEMMAAPITVVGDALEPGAPAVLFPTRIYGGGEDTGQGRQYDVAPDGRFLINTELPGNAAPITLIQNWQPGN